MILGPHGTGPQAALLATHSGKAKGIVNATGIIAAPLTVGRVFEDQFNVELLRRSDPLQLARWYVTTIQGPVIHENPTVTYFEGPNEQAMGSEDDMVKFGIFEAERARILRQEYNVGAAVGGFATGNPNNDLIRYFQIALEAAKLYGGILHFHEYGNTLPPSTQVAGGFLLGKYRRWLEQDPAIKIAITECGTDNVPPDGKPWRMLDWTDEQYAIWLWQYELELRKESRILAAFVFCFGGGPGWSKFELENSRVADLLIQFDKADPEKEPIMTKWIALDDGTSQDYADVDRAIEALGFEAGPPEVLQRFKKKSVSIIPFKVKMLQKFGLFASPVAPFVRNGATVYTGNELEVIAISGNWWHVKTPDGWLENNPDWVVKL